MDKTLKHHREGFAGQRLVRLTPAALARAKRTPLVRELYVADIGHFPQSRGHTVARPRGCEQNIFIYNARGRGWAELAGRRWEVPPEHAIAIPAGVRHRYGSDDEIPWEIYWFHFGGSGARALLQLLDVAADRPLLYVPASVVLAEAFEDVYRWTREGDSGGALFALASGLRRFFSLVLAHRRSPGDKSRHAEDRILRAIGRMHERPADARPLAGWAREAGLSAPHFSALFRRQTGCPPMRFLNRIRLQKACELLDLGDAPVNAIGREVGFDDPFYFCRQFRKEIGVSPRAYRKRIKG